MWYKTFNSRRIMYIMRGPSGSGKSTKAKELGISGTTLSTDDFWMKNGKYEFDINLISEAHQWNQKRAREYLKKGVSPVIIDNTNIEPWEMKPYVEMAQQYGYQVQIAPVEVKNTAEELAQRNKHGVPADAIQKMLDKYNPNVNVRDILKSQPPENKQAQFGAGYGEHWIDEDGNLMYADGDIGSMNHEAHVIQRAQSTIAGEGWDDSEFVNWEGFLESVAQEIVNAAKTNTRLKNRIEKATGGDIYTIRLNDVVGYDFVDEELLRRGVNKELLNIAHGRGNVRLFGMKAWGWKRVMNNYIETFTLTPKDVGLIVRGISELAAEDEDGSTKWNIEVVSNGKYFTNIPLSIIEKGPVAINSYARTLKVSGWFSSIRTSQYIGSGTWGYWLSPTGSLIPLAKTHGHIDELQKLGIKCHQDAFKKGYVRLVTEHEVLYVNKAFVPLNEGQIRTLNYMSKNYNFTKFIIDDDHGYEEYDDQMMFNKHIREKR